MKEYANFLMAVQDEYSPKLDGCAGELSKNEQDKARKLIALGLSDHLISCLPELEECPDDDELLMERYIHAEYHVRVDILNFMSGRLSGLITQDYSIVSPASRREAIEMVIDKLIETEKTPSITAMSHIVQMSARGNSEYVKYLCRLCNKFPSLGHYLTDAYGSSNERNEFIADIANGHVLPDAAVGIVENAFVNAETYQDTMNVLRAAKLGKVGTLELIEISRLAYNYSYDEPMECQAIAALGHLGDDLYKEDIMDMYEGAGPDKRYHIVSYVVHLVKAGL